MTTARANDARTAWYIKTHRDPINAQWHAYQRFKKFELSRGLFEDLIIDNCFYCGAEPSPVNGIDRVDNSRHYAEDNVVTACKTCNRAKHVLGRAEFEAWGSRLGRNLAQHAHA